MLDAGEDPLFLARRVVRMAVEDIGLADPQALVIANAAKDAYDFLGHPEGELAIAQAVIYVATAPKSNAAYKAFGAAMRSAKEDGSLLPPKHILNAPTKLMKSEGYGEGYEYDHDTPEAFSGQDYFPEALGRQKFYDPPDRGFEREIRKRLDYWAKLRKERGHHEPPRQIDLSRTAKSVRDDKRREPGQRIARTRQSGALTSAIAPPIAQSRSAGPRPAASLRRVAGGVRRAHRAAKPRAPPAQRREQPHRKSRRQGAAADQGADRHCDRRRSQHARRPLS